MTLAEWERKYKALEKDYRDSIIVADRSGNDEERREARESYQAYKQAVPGLNAILSKLRAKQPLTPGEDKLAREWVGPPPPSP